MATSSVRVCHNAGVRDGAFPAKVVVEGRELALTNLEKVLYPVAGFTKGQVIGYYRAVAPVLLPHLRGRPLTLRRYPNGVEAEAFFEKALPARRPEWVQVAPIWSETSRRTVNYCLCNDLPTLVWLANMAALELHPSLSLAAEMERPTCLVFDLDPGAPAGMGECCRVALWLRDVLEPLGLQSFPKTSGSKGLQVYIPLSTAVTYEGTKAFSHQVASLLEREHPGQVVANMRKELREGRVLVDWSQNSRHKTTIGVYSLRGRERPTVSTPVGWEEVEAGASGRAPLAFEAPEALERAERLGDLFAPVLTMEQGLPPAAGTPAG